MRSISITPFRKANDEVEPYCHLKQPDGAKGSLLARYGAKGTITVRWKTEPALPKELSRWRVGIVKSDSEDGFENCIDERSIAGSRRTVTIKLDMDFDEPPDYGVCIRVAPLNADGSEIINQETGEAFYADSNEFFLVAGGGNPPPEPPRQSLRTVPILAFGRLEVAVDMRETVLAETEPEWINKDLKYFRLRLNDRRILNIGLSYSLWELHTALLNAGGYLLGGPADARPVLEVRLAAKQRDLLERLHVNTNWVITLDRFFTLDYYDSPHKPGLDEVARKYVLDYSPEFTEGLGHRMMVTTAWHEEIGSLLSQAMDDLGFSNIDASVSHLLHDLKTISGRLALDALESPTSAAAAVGLGVVTAWLQKNKKLRQAVLVPVDIYPRLFSHACFTETKHRRCHLHRSKMAQGTCTA